MCLVLGILNLVLESDWNDKKSKKSASQSAQVVVGEEGDLTTQKENGASKFNENASHATGQNGGATDSAKGVNFTGPNPFPREKKTWSQLPVATMARLQKYASTPAVVADAGMVRNFRLAMDELYVRDPETGKGKGVAVASASDLAALMAQMEKIQTETGFVPELVMYEDGVERNEFTRRVVTRELMLESDSQAMADQAAKSVGLVFRDAPAYAPGKFLYLAESSPEALAAWTQLEEQKIVSSSLLLAKQQSKRAMPNDSLINQQWHLKFNNQSGAVLGTDLNIENIWAYPINGAGFRGRGIRIGIVDDGVQTSHPDFVGNIDTTNDYDWNDTTPTDPSPGAGDDHGTACAGDAAARGNNSLGVSGSAPEATLVGMRLIAANTTDQQEADAVNYLPQLIQIKSNSWGPNDTGTILEAPGPLTLAALKNAVETGRAGKGTIILWAGGNGLDVNDNSNYDGYANSIYTIAVGAFDSQSRQAWYSESGANLVIVSPSSGTSPALGKTTTDRTGADGYVAGDYESDFGGTSSATPTASGVVALMLEANPNLGWRDVQEILMRSAKKVNPSDTDWKTPVAPANINHNHKFGAGLIDATAAVNLAATWVNLSSQLKRTVSQTGLSVAIPNINTTGITREFNVSAQDNLCVEHVTVAVSITHTARGNLKITLTSPSGTVSRLAEVRSDSNDNYSNWKFMTVRNWGENAAGTWRLKISDESGTGNTTGGTLTLATMEVFGSSAAPINPPPSITLISPSDGSVFSPGATINVEASASDLKADGTAGAIQSVEFLVNGVAVGTNNAAPYIFAWQPVQGNYTLSARATDTEGASASTAAISVQVANRRPSMTAGQIAQSGEIFSDQALALSGLTSTDPDGDTVSYAYQWQSSSNGVSYTDGAGLTSATLPAAPERSGSFWRCRITPSDAGGAGEPFFTAAVSVNRRPPTNATVGQAFSYDSDLFLAGTETNFTRKAILSEFSQGPSNGAAEWVEFLVLRPGSLRGWKVQDAGGTTVTLADVPAWDNIPAGTLVVIYNGASKDALLPTDDLSVGSDGKMVVSSTDAGMCTGSWPSLSNNGDGVILRDATNTILSQVGYGSGTTTPNIGAVSGARSANYRGNTEDGGLVASNWSIETATLARSVRALLPGVSLVNGAYSQNFGSIPGASGTAYPSGWTCYSASTEDAAMTVGSSASTGAANYNYGSMVGLLGSGSGFETSSIVLAIANTSGVSSLNISYKIIKVREQSRSHDFNLEYSLTSPTSGFLPVAGASYTSGAIAEGTVTSFNSISLPTDAVNQSSVVYLRWVYKPSATPGTGSRDGLALDDVVISAGEPVVTLALNVDPSTFAENAGASAATGTLTVSQAQSTDLVVSVTSSDTTEATVPISVTIPVNQTTATFTVAAVDDQISDGSVNVTLTATAGSLSATATINVTDNEVALSGVTPGAPNGGDNTVWVSQLRSGSLNQPALFRLASDAPAWVIIDQNTGVISGTPPSTGDFTIKIERTNSLGDLVSQSFTISVLNASNGMTFSTWASNNSLTDDNALLLSDPDRDGRSNLLEFYMGSNPSSSVDSPIVATATGTTLSITYQRAKGLANVSAVVEWTTDLSLTSWNTNNVTEKVEDKGSYEQVTATVPSPPGSTKMFMRLRVTTP
jgi:subtilisin family serine protease